LTWTCVGLNDLDTLAQRFGTSGTWIDGDLNLDDLAILGTFWNSGVAQSDLISFDAALSTVSFAVPEPGGLGAGGDVAVSKPIK